MKVFKRIKEAGDKLVFCYAATENFHSFLKLIWFTKLYRFRKKSVKYVRQQDKCFSIFLKAFPVRKIFIRIYAGDIDIFYEIFYKKIYELPNYSPRGIIIDAGANVGFATLYFISQIPGATIYCIEPDPDNFAFLKKNLSGEINSGNVVPVQAALASRDGHMHLKKSHFKYNSGITGVGNENSIKVSTYSVKGFLNKFNIEKVSLFKIDIEGSEENVFEEDSSWLVEVSDVLIEIHSKKIKELCFKKFELEKFRFLPCSTRRNTDVFHFTC
jgi:FkbM family methyltransferase